MEEKKEFASTEEKALLAKKIRPHSQNIKKSLTKQTKAVVPKTDETKKIYKSIYTLYVLHDFSRQEIAKRLGVTPSMIGMAIRYVVQQQDAMTEVELQQITIDRIRYRKQGLLKQMKTIKNEQGLWLKFHKELRLLDNYESKVDGSLKGDIQIDNSKTIILQNVRKEKTIEVAI